MSEKEMSHEEKLDAQRQNLLKRAEADEAQTDEKQRKALAKKKLVLQGITYRRDVELAEYPNLIFVLAPISDGEYSQVRELTTKSINLEKLLTDRKIKLSMLNIDQVLQVINIPQLIHNLDKAKYLAVSFSLSRGMEERWTPKDIEALKIGVPDKLYNILDEISGLSERMQQKTADFRTRKS